jgi:tetratricopeptide (TPR) repeat protein
MVGELDKALVCFEKAAKKGAPNAVASLVWLRTVLDEHQKAVAAFEQYLPHARQYISTLQGAQIPREETIDEVHEEITTMLRTLEEREDLTDEEKAEGLAQSIAETSPQIPNIQSNAAISYFALGDVARANELWAEAAADEHYEAPLFMAVAARRQSQELKGLPPIDQEKQGDLINDCDTALKHAVGWAREWYEEARALAVEL